MAGGGTTTHQINISVNTAPLTSLQLAANQAQAAVAAIGQGASGLGSIVNGAQAAYGALSNVVSQAFDAAKALADMAKEGAKLQTLDAAFKALGSSTKDLEKLRELTGGLVSDEDLQQASNLAKLFKLPEDEIPKLIKLAQGASAALGTTTAKAISDTFTAASRQSKMIADNMGIVIGDMGKMYDDFAKKHGTTSDKLTDKQKQLAFVQKMIAEGGRQMELAGIAQGNAAMKAEAQYANFEATLKKAAAEAFASSGAYEMMGGMLSQLQVLFTENGATLAELVMPAFEAVAGLVEPLAMAFGALLPLLEPMTQLFQVLAVLLRGLAPVLGMVSTVVASLASVIIDVVLMAMEPLLRSAADVSDMFGFGMGDGLRKAADAFADARVNIDANSEALKGNAAAAKDAEDAQTKLTEKMLANAGVLGSVTAVAMAEGLDAKQVNDAMQWAIKGADMKGLAAQIGRDSAKEFGEKYRASGEQAMKLAAQQMAQKYVKEMGIGGPHGVLMVREMTKVFEAGGAAIVEEQRKADARLSKQSIGTAQEMVRLYNDAMMFGQTSLADSAMEGAKNQEEALQKLELRYEEFYAALEQMDLSAPVFESTVAKMDDLFNLAGEQIAGKFDKDKGKGGGGKAPDWFKAEWDARLSLMDEYSRQAAEIETRYQDQMATLHADQTQLRIDLTMKMVEELDRLEAEHAAKQRMDEAALKDYLLGSESDYYTKVEQIRAEAEAKKAQAQALGMGPDAMSAIDAEAARREREAGGPGMFGALDSMSGGLADAWGAYAEAAQARQNEAEEAARAHTERMAGLFQNMGSTITQSLVAISIGGEDLRSNLFKTMGSLFGQLSTAFLAWATAEGNLLAGNPFGAAAAAITLGLVASAISAFGSRGKGGGGGGAKGTTSMSRGALESRRDKEQPAQTVIYNYGFATPDAIARSVSRGDARGRDLRGREKA